MKGPSERLKYDLRRIWECPICRHREGTGGDVTSRLCSCQAQVAAVSRQYMRLIQDGARRILEPKAPPVSPSATPRGVNTELVIAPAPANTDVQVETTVVVDQTAQKPMEVPPANEPSSAEPDSV